MLSDRDIRIARNMNWLAIEPFDNDALQPASYDLTLDRHFLIPNINVDVIDMADVPKDHMGPLTVGPQGIVVGPGAFMLASTRESVKIGPDHLGRVEGKSSLGRLGLMVHITAGFIDPGFKGQITLEIHNVAPWDIILYPGQRIAQIAFSKMNSTPTKVYGAAGNHYQGQVGPVESRFEMGMLPGFE